MPKNSQGAMKTNSSRALKWAPTWHSCMTTSKSLSGQPNPDPIQRLAIKGFWDSHTGILSGGLFWGSLLGHSHGNLRFAWHFFYHPNLSVRAKCQGFTFFQDDPKLIPMPFSVLKTLPCLTIEKFESSLLCFMFLVNPLREVRHKIKG